MPGLENGSSIQDAFTWDHTQCPGGTRVFGRTTEYGGGGNVQDYWAVYLLAGRTYTFQTRLPTAWDTTLYLYDANGYYLAYDADSGDDGNSLSKIVYTPSKEGWYFLSIYGYYYYGGYGPYVLESVPAPKSFRNFCAAMGRFSARVAVASEVPARFDATRERVAVVQAARNAIRAKVVTSAAGHFASRAGCVAVVGGRFTAWKTATVVVVPGRWSARVGTGARGMARFAGRGLQDLALPARCDIRQPMDGAVAGRFESHGRVEGMQPARYGALVLPGWAVYARDTATGVAVRLGFIPADADPKELADVPLPDGVYEIEVRPSEWYWDECRGRKVITLLAGEIGGGGEPVQGLPVIQNLRREIVGFTSVIKWNVVAEGTSAEFQFGLWFGTTSPVDTSGPPHQTVDFATGQGEYQATRAQTASECVAVAAFTSTEQGSAAELLIDWDTMTPISPPNQHSAH
jgi:hypothetical protein